VVALLDAIAEDFRRGDREHELDLAVLELACQFEAGIREHRERRTVLCHHLGDESHDAGCARA